MDRRDFLVGLVGMPLITKAFHTNAVSVEQLMGRKTPVFTNPNILLQKEALIAFLKMQKFAEKDGISLYIVSAYRSFTQQEAIWNRKYTLFNTDGSTSADVVHKIIQYSSIPGMSRHHWGTDLDIIDANVGLVKDPLRPENFKENGVYSRMYQWMMKYSTDFGFILTYTSDQNRTGFKFEPWHFSYKPLSKGYLEQHLRIDYQQFKVSWKSLKGSEVLDVNFFENYSKHYLKGIHSELLP